MRIPRKKLNVYLIVALVLTVVQMIAMFIVNDGAMGTGDIGSTLIMLLVSIVLLPFFYMGFFINWKKTLLGIIVPIPILSMLIEWFKGAFYGFKGFLVVVKKQDALIIGKEEEAEPVSANTPVPPYPPQTPQYPPQQYTNYPGQAQNQNPQNPNHPYPNNPYPNSQYPNGQYSNSQYPSNQYPSNQNPSNSNDPRGGHYGQ